MSDKDVVGFIERFLGHTSDLYIETRVHSSGTHNMINQSQLGDAPPILTQPSQDEYAMPTLNGQPS